MWRVIVRISFFHDRGSRLRNHLVPMFEAMGLANTHTGTWESAEVELAQAATQMNLILQAIANPRGVPGVDPQAALNHLWVYIDRVEEVRAVSRNWYSIVNQTTEDRLDEADSLDEALRIARELALDGPVGEPIAIERGGAVVRQFVLIAEGRVEEESVNPVQSSDAA